MRARKSLGRSVLWVVGLMAVAGALSCNAIWGIDDYEFGGAGATTTATGTGGTAGTAGTGGATGGTGGSGETGGGGSEPSLVDRGLVVRYFVDEADDGQGPSELLDATPSPLNLAMTYSSTLSFTAVHSNRGLHWTAHGSPGEGRVTG